MATKSGRECQIKRGVAGECRLTCGKRSEPNRLAEGNTGETHTHRMICAKELASKRGDYRHLEERGHATPRNSRTNATRSARKMTSEGILCQVALECVDGKWKRTTKNRGVVLSLCLVKARAQKFPRRLVPQTRDGNKGDMSAVGLLREKKKRMGNYMYMPLFTTR